MGLVDREQQVREVEEGLEHQQVRAALEEPVDLLAEGGPDRRLVGMAELARRRAQRPDAAADPRVAAADVARLAGDLGGAAVEAAGLGRQAERIEPHPVGAERDGLDQVSPRVEVLAVERGDEVRPGRGELVEAGALGDAAREQQRAHAAVREQRGGGEAGGKPVAGQAHAGSLSGRAV